MLTELHVQNFKAWRDLKIELGKVTALFGENSSGKSSLLQFLLMLKQTKNAADRSLVMDFGGGPTELVNLGNYEGAVHRRTADEAEPPDMAWTLAWDLDDRLEVHDRLHRLSFSGKELRHTARVGLESGSSRRLVAKGLAYWFAETTFGLRPKASDRTRFDRLTAEGPGAFMFDRSVGRTPHDFGPVKTHLFPSAARHLYRNADFLSFFENAYEDLMDRIYYLGPLREHPRREYRWTGAGRDGVGDSGEFTIDAILAKTQDLNWRENVAPRKHRMPFQAMMAYWLEALGLIESFEVREVVPGSSLYQALVRRYKSSPETTLTDVGFGVSQVLPVLVLLYYVPEGSIVLMEQPEIHLHPSVQSGLADVMLAVAARRDVQIVVESHSEHLLRRFQRRVAEEEVSPSDLKLHFVRSERGAAVLEPLRLNKLGGIENWPDKFFGDEMGEIAATSRAGLERLRRANG